MGSWQPVQICFAFLLVVCKYVWIYELDATKLVLYFAKISKLKSRASFEILKSFLQRTYSKLHLKAAVIYSRASLTQLTCYDLTGTSWMKPKVLALLFNGVLETFALLSAGLTSIFKMPQTFQTRFNARLRRSSRCG